MTETRDTDKPLRFWAVVRDGEGYAAVLYEDTREVGPRIYGAVIDAVQAGLKWRGCTSEPKPDPEGTYLTQDGYEILEVWSVPEVSPYGGILD